MRDKAIENVTNELIGQVKKIQRPKDKRQAVYETQKFNQMIEGVQNYYRLATDINIDCSKIQRRVRTTIKNGLKGRIKKHGIIGNKHIKERYGKSQQLRFVDDKPLIPIGYVQTKNPMYKKKSICKYTESVELKYTKIYSLTNMYWLL